MTSVKKKDVKRIPPKATKKVAVNPISPSTKPKAAGKASRRTAVRNSQTGSEIRFTAALLRPGGKDAGADWCFLILPKQASEKLPSRGQATVEGTMNGTPFQATLEPDGEGGHWLKVDRRLREAAGAKAGDRVTLEIVPVAEEPEPAVPPDLQEALAAAPAKVREAWSDITPAARRDFVHWIVSPKKAETRAKRIETACDMLAKGKRRPCCFDRSGMYSKSLSCPVAEPLGEISGEHNHE